MPGRTALLFLALHLAACQSCPPSWAGSLSDEGAFIVSAGECGEVFVDADAETLALTRAARRLADHLGLDVERRLIVVLAGGRLQVEAVGAAGPTTSLSTLELVALVRCDGRVYAQVRLPRP